MAIKRNTLEILHRVSGNLESLGAFLKDQNGAVIDLASGQTVTFRLVRLRDNAVIITGNAASIIDTATGEVRYGPTGTEMDLAAGQNSDQHAMYWLVAKNAQPTIRLPYDGARQILILQKETVKE